jgi:amino acid transporter
MSSMRTIGLFSAILININVIVGSGIFINLHPFIRMGGTGSFLAYIVAAACLLPVVVVLAYLARAHPESGGLYVYTKTYLHPFVGFLCGWGYFVGKSVSVGMMAHILVTLCEQLFPLVSVVPHLMLVAGLLLFLAGAHVIGASLQGPVQGILIAAKVVPVICMIGFLLWHGVQVPISCAEITGSSLSGMVPIALYAMIGFEVTCTIAHLFVRPEYTIVRAFIYGFLSVAALLATFQFSVSALLPAHMLGVVSANPSAQLVSIAGMYAPDVSLIALVLSVCVYCSVLGGMFSILTSNCWNVYRLAVHGHMPGAHLLTRLTRSNIPWVSLLIEVCIAVVAVGITSQLVPLQKMCILCVVFAFFCAMLAALRARKIDGSWLIHPCIVGAAVLSTAGLFSLTLYQIFLHGVSVPYVLLCGSGVLSAAWYQYKSNKAV